MIDMDLTPLANEGSVFKHKEIFEGLQLDLKIAVDGSPGLRDRSPGDICRILQSIRKRTRIQNHAYDAASAVYAHEMFFRTIVPRGKCHFIPMEKSAELLEDSFGSVGNFFYLARTLAGGCSSPGFLWLFKKYQRKKILLGLTRLPLYTLPDLGSCTPLMAVDLWEHAYMDTWGRDISGFADAYLKQTDWEKVFSYTTQIPLSHDPKIPKIK